MLSSTIIIKNHPTIKELTIGETVIFENGEIGEFRRIESMGGQDTFIFIGDHMYSYNYFMRIFINSGMREEPKIKCKLSLKEKLELL